MNVRLLYVVAFLAIILSLSSCSRSIGYRFADTFILWQLDNYVTLEGEQRERVKTEIEDLLQWHAESELPKYHHLLVELQTLVENDQLTQQELQQIALQVETFWLNLRKQVFPILVAELAAMSTAQHNELIAAATYVD